MKRLTKPLVGESYEAAEGCCTKELILRLSKYENMHEALLREETQLVSEMEKLRSEGRTKTATYRQLFADKLLVMHLIDRLNRFGL